MTQLTGIRKTSSLRIGNLPLLSIAMGPDPAKGEIRGHAKGVIAIGDMATGWVALGVWLAVAWPWAACPSVS